MNIQLIAVIILFLAAVAYLGKGFFKTFSAKKECGCSCKCGVQFQAPESKTN